MNVQNALAKFLWVSLALVGESLHDNDTMKMQRRLATTSTSGARNVHKYTYLALILPPKGTLCIERFRSGER